ncbi:MAG: antibiotic biosynthesis monooxygenase [Dehalococcoidia bacterium]|nr:antibiotic biosynthesis monooxygenase [Dehalococcoidia bacterium]
MLILYVNVDVKPDRIPEFLTAIRDNAACAVRDEPGCLGFDVLQSVDDTTKFVFYEVYRDQDALAAHRQTPHFKRYFERTQDLVAGPLSRHMLHNLHPDDSAWVKRAPFDARDTMVFRLLSQTIKEGSLEAYRSTMGRMAAAMARNEPGALRFDVIEESDAPGNIVAYEVYRDQAARAAHRETAHFKEFAPAIRELVASAEGKEYRNVTK